jgi:hypothetical protein
MCSHPWWSGPLRKDALFYEAHHCSRPLPGASPESAVDSIHRRLTDESRT